MSTPAELMGHSMVAPLARDLGSSQAIAPGEIELINANSKGQNVLIYTNITLHANLTLSGGATFLKGGKITTNGFTLTLNGPITAGASQIGLNYQDTTLDADGKPIQWNGTAWVDATGAVV